MDAGRAWRGVNFALILALAVGPAIASLGEGNDAAPPIVGTRCVANNPIAPPGVTLQPEGGESGSPAFNTAATVAPAEYSSYEPNALYSNLTKIIYIDGPGCLWASTNSGSSFNEQNVNAPSGPVAGRSDSATTILPTGELYYTDFEAGAGVNVGWHPNNSAVGGQWTWASSYLTVAARGVDRPWMMNNGSVASIVYLHDVGIKLTGEIDRNVPFVAFKPPRFQAGQPVAPEVDVIVADIANGEDIHKMGRPAFDSSMLVVPIALTKGSYKAVGALISTDNGTNWANKTIQIHQSFGTPFPMAAIDDAGNVYVAWSNATPTGSGEQIWVSMKPQNGTAFRAPVLVSTSTTGVSRFLPTIVAGGNGRVGVAYYEAPSINNETAKWRVYYSYAADAYNATNASFTTVDVYGEPVLEGIMCAGNGFTCIGTEHWFGDFIGAARLWNGLVGIVFNDDYLESHPDAPDSSPMRFSQQVSGGRLR